MVETESAVRHQTLSHFIHTFIKNYDRESAADRTMRSRYVPTNIKTQLLAAVRECESQTNDSVKISSIADMGLYIDASCNEIVYYHSITSSVLQWTLSLYVHDAHIKNIIKTVLDDMGRIGDEDIQFILEKYKYNEELKMAGTPMSVSGVDSLLSFLRPKKFQPTVSYYSYYTQSMMLKLARSMLQNSAMFLNNDVFNAASREGDSCDVENTMLYDEYTREKRKLATVIEKQTLQKVRSVLKEGTSNSEGMPMKEPPGDISTAYDRSHLTDSETSEDDEVASSSESDECEGEGDRCVTHPNLESPLASEDVEVENIFAKKRNDTGAMAVVPSSSARLCPTGTLARRLVVDKNLQLYLKRSDEYFFRAVRPESVVHGVRLVPLPDSPDK